MVVVVVRTGGIAGIRRQWKVEPAPKEAPRWVALIDRCPWDAAPSSDRGADRFVWRIVAEAPGAPPREAELPDSRLDGPWRTLVDEVRGAAPSRRRSAAQK